MDLTPELLLHAYRIGVFPMAESKESTTVHWYAPDPRAILPLDDFYVSKNLRKLVRQQRFEIRYNYGFEDVMRACAERESSWISESIVQVYTELHRMGFAHTVECWLDGELAGGLYGVSLGGGFFGESMFHNIRDASKVALVHLVSHLKSLGYVLLDTQFTTTHLEQFGVIEIPRTTYETLLAQALQVNVLPWESPSS